MASYRIPHLLYPCHRVCQLHDLQSRPETRPDESSGLSIDLFHRGIYIRHVRQGFRNSHQAHLCRRQPVHPRVHLCFLLGPGSYHSHPNELPEQSNG